MNDDEFRNEEELFLRNWERFAKFCPEASEQVKGADCSRFSFCTTDRGEQNLKLATGLKEHFFHSQKGALNQAQQWFDQVLPFDKRVICLYGMGLGYYYDVLKDWLHMDRGRYLVFIDDDLAALHMFLKSKRAAAILQDTQVVIQYFSMPGEREWGKFRLAFQWFTFPFAVSKVHFDALEIYKEIKAHGYELAVNQLRMNMRDSIRVIKEHIENQPLVSKNGYSNLLLIPESYRGSRLFEKMYEVPTVICGAGPSISKQYELLKTIRDRAIIFGSGTGLNVLTRHGIMPHFGVCLDPYDTQQSRYLSQFAYETPFFLNPRFYYKASKLIQGPLLYLSTYEDSHQWFYKELGLEDMHGCCTGVTTTNVCANIAVFMGCNPIVLVGVDMAYTESSRYAAGVGVHPGDEAKHRQDLTKISGDLLVAHGGGGEDVTTKWEWILEAAEFTRLANEKLGISLLNASEGLTILDVPHLPFQTIVKTRLQKSYDIQNWIHCEMQLGSNQAPSLGKVLELMEMWKGSLKTCVDTLQEIQNELIDIERRLLQGEELSLDEPNERECELWERVKDELVYSELLQKQERVYELLIAPEMNKLKFFPDQYDGRRKASTMIEMKKGHLKFILDLAQIHLTSLEEAVKEHEEDSKHNANKTPLPEASRPSSDEAYLFSEGVLKLFDPEFGLNIEEPFIPALIPEEVKAAADKNKGAYIYAEEGSQEGQALMFHSDGSNKAECYYLNGLLHGPSSFYMPDGVLLARTWFFQGKRMGKSWQYYATGKVYSLQRYKDGLLEGRQEYYHPDGQRKTVMHYHEGELDGELFLYYPSGKLWREQHFAKGMLHGQEVIFSKNGEKVLEAEYKNNLPAGRTRLWHPNGKLAKEIVFHDNPLNFDLYLWDERGKLIHKQISIPNDVVQGVIEKSVELKKSLERANELLEKLKIDMNQSV